MKSPRLQIGKLLGLVLLAAACTTPLQRNLVAPAAPSAHLTQQPLKLRVMPTVITTPANESEGQDTRTRMFLFLGLFAYSDARGNLLPESKYYAQDLPGEIQHTLEQTLNQSGLFRPASSGAADLELHSQLLHLYGAAYNKSSMFVTYGAATSSRRKYLPYGSAVLRLILVDVRSGQKRVVWDATLSGSYLPDANDAELAKNGLANASTLAAVSAYRDLLAQVPARLSPIASRLGGKPTGRALPENTFYLARLLPDSRYIERVAIASDSGQVTHSEVQIRKEPIFSAPDELVLDPYQGGVEIFDDASYDNLAQRLASRFPIKRRNNARLWSLDAAALRQAQAAADSSTE